LTRGLKVTLVVVGVLLIDQVLKVWIKTNMELGEYFKILGLDFARIHFVENKGMAFGFEFGGSAGKIALSLFRLVAIGFLIYLIRELIKSGEKFGLLVSFGLILAGAIGNVIDSAFYGLIFSASPYHGGVAEMVPWGTGYASFLKGSVVDMLYFPLFDGHFPDWMPFWGGNRLEFFKPVFNIADTSITTGVLSILVFHLDFFKHSRKKDTTEATAQLPESEQLDQLQ
jgi:signal peptidase II